MKKLNKINKKSKLKNILESSDKKSLRVYIIIRFLILVCLIMQIIHHSWNNAFLCLLTLILITMPFIVEKKFKIETICSERAMQRIRRRMAVQRKEEHHDTEREAGAVLLLPV